jgi:hypothetical protein
LMQGFFKWIRFDGQRSYLVLVVETRHAFPFHVSSGIDMKMMSASRPIDNSFSSQLASAVYLLAHFYLLIRA